MPPLLSSYQVQAQFAYSGTWLSRHHHAGRLHPAFDGRRYLYDPAEIAQILAPPDGYLSTDDMILQYHRSHVSLNRHHLAGRLRVLHHGGVAYWNIEDAEQLWGIPDGYAPLREAATAAGVMQKTLLAAVRDGRVKPIFRLITRNWSPLYPIAEAAALRTDADPDSPGPDWIRGKDVPAICFMHAHTAKRYANDGHVRTVLNRCHRYFHLGDLRAHIEKLEQAPIPGYLQVTSFSRAAGLHYVTVYRSVKALGFSLLRHCGRTYLSPDQQAAIINRSKEKQHGARRRSAAVRGDSHGRDRECAA